MIQGETAALSVSAAVQGNVTEVKSKLPWTRMGTFKHTFYINTTISEWKMGHISTKQSISTVILEKNVPKYTHIIPH